MTQQILPDVVRDFERVPTEVVQQAAKFPASIFADVAGRRGTLDGRIRPLDPGMRIAGPALTVEVRLYDRLFKSEMPDAVDYLADLNPVSLDIIPDARVEPSVRDALVGARYQFERLGYFCIDQDSSPARMVFNRTVTLKDTWARIERRS